MEDIKFVDTHFTFRKIVPEIDDELTTQWGRKTAMNLINGKGIIGTTIVPGNEIARIGIPADFTYSYAPSIVLYWSNDNGSNWHGVRQGGPENNRELRWCMNGNLLMIANGNFYREETRLVLFRLNGV